MSVDEFLYILILLLFKTIFIIIIIFKLQINLEARAMTH